ncbi:MAG: hypothetical protein AAGH15_22220 [Myxococcota bacterium]
MRRPIPMATGVAAMLLALVALPAAADPDAEPSAAVTLAAPADPLARLAGTWELSTPRAAWRDRERAIRQATARLGLLVREPARRQLRDEIPVHYRVELARAAEGLRTHAGAYDLTFPVDDAPHPWTDPWGKRIEVRQRLAGAALVQRFESRSGALTQTMAVDARGERVRLDVQVEARRLPRPVRFSVRYRRR